WWNVADWMRGAAARDGDPTAPTRAALPQPDARIELEATGDVEAAVQVGIVALRQAEPRQREVSADQQEPPGSRTEDPHLRRGDPGRRRLGVMHVDRGAEDPERLVGTEGEGRAEVHPAHRGEEVDFARMGDRIGLREEVAQASGA